jgi:hypothetical protein
MPNGKHRSTGIRHTQVQISTLSIPSCVTSDNFLNLATLCYLHLWKDILRTLSKEWDYLYGLSSSFPVCIGLMGLILVRMSSVAGNGYST